MVASMVRPFSQRRRLLVEHLLDGARQELLLAAGLLELGRAELGVMRLGVQRVGGQAAERLAPRRAR